MDQSELIKKINSVEDTADRNALKNELLYIFEGMKEVSRGFLKIAQAANRVKEKKLYQRIGYNTFEVFCNDIIGLTRKQVSLYIRIAEITEEYNDIFDERMVLSIGPTKMNVIYRGITRIESSITIKKEIKKKVEELIAVIAPDHTVAETEIIINDFIRDIKIN